MQWHLAKTEADYRAVARLLEIRRKEIGGDPEGDLASRHNTEEWLLGAAEGVAVFSHRGKDWVLERLWIAPGYRRSGYFMRAGMPLWERRYGSVGLRQPHASSRAMLRRYGFGPELHDAMAEAGLAKPGQEEPFVNDDVWVRHGKARR